MVANFMKTRRIFNYIDAIIPVPPSKERSLQPVTAIAIEAGKLTGKKVDTNYIKKLKSTSELKSITNPDDRAKILENAFSIIDNRYVGKDVLLFDDLYRSGTTLKELTNVLYKYGKVKNVYIITMTKTRVNR
jgi:predicted amidophosphoribosyltransferase